MQNLLKQPISKRSIQIFSILVSIDFLFIVLHIFHVRTGLLLDSRFFITMDRGYAEIYQYLKLLGIVFCMRLLFIRNRSPIYLGWLYIFLLVLADDAIQIHERLGIGLGRLLRFQPLLGLRPQDFGELLVFSAYALLILAIVVTSYRKERNSTHKVASAGLFVLLLLLMLFSVVVDALHIAANSLSSPQINPAELNLIFEILEDGGELVVVSLIAGFSYLLVNPKPQLSAVPRSSVLSSR